MGCPSPIFLSFDKLFCFLISQIFVSLVLTDSIIIQQKIKDFLLIGTYFVIYQEGRSHPRPRGAGFSRSHYKFEVYKGFNKEPLSESDRFFHLQEKSKPGYYPIKIVASYDLDNLPESISDLEKSEED